MIPVFVIVRDRVSVLRRCIDSFRLLGDVDIVLIDNGSSYPLMLEFLDSWVRGGGMVFFNEFPFNDFRDLSVVVRDVVDLWFSFNDADFFVVTDPDILLESPSPLWLDFYVRLLDAFPGVVCVGPMLRIDDLPECFGLRDAMVRSHKWQFWDRPFFLFDGVGVQFAFIDTTFALYRKGFVFDRLNVGLRTREPFIAKHLDWYIDTNNLSDEERYYFEHASGVSSLANHLLRGVPV